jgi:NhaA family Na+:H+ antiporter
MDLNYNEPETPIEKLVKPIEKLLNFKSVSGIVLFFSVVVAMIMANGSLAEMYHHFIHLEFTFEIGNWAKSIDLLHIINDGLMAVFFFHVGLEIKREMISGEMRTMKKAAMPIAAALGGMLFPALFYLFFNNGTGGQSGWGIPMATDIAFTLGVLSLFGKKVPVSLKIFLTALAIVDDLGAVLVIAFFYTSEISFDNLLIGAAFLGALILYNIFGGRKTTVFAIIGIGGLWLAFFMSGVHATIAGVLAALTIPARSKIDKDYFVEKLGFLINQFRVSSENGNPLATEEQHEIIEEIKETRLDIETPLQKLEHALTPFVNFVILPVFAFANAGITLEGDLIALILHPISIGIGIGLLLGKFFGIVLFSKILVWLKIAELPKGLQWPHIYASGVLAGIGFTMSLFISDLAFEDENYIMMSKAAILIASALAAIIGVLLLILLGNKKEID